MLVPYRLDVRPTPPDHPLRQLARTIQPSPHPLPEATPDAWISGWVKGIRDQGQEGSCTGHGVTGAMEVRHGVLHGHPIPEQLSPAYAYARARLLEHTFPMDVGATVGDAVLAAHLYGVCRESMLRYRENPADGPTPEADKDAALWKIPLPLWVPVNVLAIKTALAARMPVVFGERIPYSFFGTGRDGKVPPRKPGEADAGSHCMFKVGFNPWGLMRVNSWGAGWGDKGFCYASWEYVLENVFECWALPLA